MRTNSSRTGSLDLGDWVLSFSWRAILAQFDHLIRADSIICSELIFGFHLRCNRLISLPSHLESAAPKSDQSPNRVPENCRHSPNAKVFLLFILHFWLFEIFFRVIIKCWYESSIDFGIRSDFFGIVVLNSFWIHFELIQNESVSTFCPKLFWNLGSLDFFRLHHPRPYMQMTTLPWRSLSIGKPVECSPESTHPVDQRTIFGNLLGTPLNGS